MNKPQNNEVPSKMFLMWVPVLIILFIKSNAVLFSLFSVNTSILIYSALTTAPILFLISFSFIFSQKGQLLYLLGLDFFISILFIVDIVYARAYGHLISIYMMIAKDVMEGLSASVISLMKWTDFLMLIDLPILFILAVKSKQQIRLKKRIHLFYFTILLSLAAICFQFAWLENSKKLGNYKMHPLLMSPIGNHMFDLYRFLYEKSDTLDSEGIDKIDFWLKNNEKFQYPNKDYAHMEGILKGKNLIVIHFESLENIVVNQSYYSQEITPNINRLLNSSIYFSNIFEQVRDGNSSDAEFMFNTSVYPLSNGSAFLRFGDNIYASLPKLLHEEGYTSIAIHGDNKEFWNRNQVFPFLGFDKFIDEEQFNDKRSIGLGILDESLFTQSISEIKKLKEPYNILIITITSHVPFVLDEKDQHLNLPNNNETSAYLQSIHYTDKVFGEFYDKLKVEGLLQNSVLMLYGDHEGIHKYYPTTTLPDNNHKLPFIIHFPGMEGFTIDKIGGQVDMMPTAAYLLGIDREKYSSTAMGRNILGNTSGSVILPTGEILGQTDVSEHLTKAQSIADMIIRGNYFGNSDIFEASKRENKSLVH